MRFARRLTAGLLFPPLVAVATLLGAVAALLWTPPGRRLTARLATEIITGSVAGRVTIGAIRGNILRHIVLENVIVADSLGRSVIEVARLEARYLLPELLAGRLVFSEVRADRLRLHLVKLPDGRLNYEAVFRTGGGPGGPPKLVELRDVVIRDGSIRFDNPVKNRPVPKLPITPHAAAPAQPRIVESEHGPMRVYTFDRLDARLPRIRVSTPDRDPILVRIASLRTDLGDPKVSIRDAVGEIITQGDSLRFRFERAALPGTVVSGGGAVRWPQDTILFDFTLDADTVDLKDLRWISPDFPDWQGAGRVTALSTSGSRTEYRFPRLTLGHGPTRATGTLTAILDLARGLGTRDLALALQQVPLAIMRPYLDTLPFDGTLDGTLRTDGFLDAMRLGGDLVFADALVPGAPRSRFLLDGTIHFGGEEGAVFEAFRLQESAIALATVKRVVPAMELPGDLRLAGRLDGPWQNARFVGTAEHLAPNAALSRLVGTVQLDTRGEYLGVAMDAEFDQLSFDALRSGYPALTARGGVTGHVVTAGTLAGLDIVADLSGEIGTVQARGRVTALAPRFGADSLVLDLTRVDLQALLGRGESTALTGRIAVTGVIDSAVAPVGRMTVALDRSRVGGVTMDAVTARLRAEAGLVHVDTAEIRWPDGRIAARGAIGWTAPDSGALTVRAEIASLQPFDSLLRTMIALPEDSTVPKRLAGALRADLVVTGSVDRPQVAGTFDADRLVLDAWSLARAAGTFTLDSLGAGGVRLDATADSLRVGEQLAESLTVAAGGRRDSLVLAASGRLRRMRFAGGGAWLPGTSQSAMVVDSLRLDLPRQQWRLVRPSRLAFADGLATLADTIALRTVDGGGAITLVGRMPGSAAGDLQGSVVGLELGDLDALLNADTSIVRGLASLDFRLGGTRDAPTLRGSAAVTGAVIGDVRPPHLRAAFDYRERRLLSQVSFWKTGERVLQVDLALPYDLALASRAERKLDGAIEISAVADSVDLAVLEAFTPSIRSTRGMMQVDLRASGTWKAPRFDGTAAILNGSMTLPALGIRPGPVNGSARFTGDSIVIDSLRAWSDGGWLDVRGHVRFQELTRAVLDLEIGAQRFLAMNVENYLTARPDLQVRLQGPLTRPVLTGVGTLNESVFYFADLVNKNVINLEDPAFADLVDTMAIRKQRLGAAFQSRFLDSLRITDLRFRLGQSVWLRSTEANVQLEGQVTVNKIGMDYRLDGHFSSQRGTYTLKIGPVNRDFDVVSGSVDYYGTPDLNAELNLLARYRVRTTDGDEFPIDARITGSILVPKLELSAPGRNYPQRELISYLLFNRSEFQSAGASEQQYVSQAIGTGVAALGTALTSEIERTLSAAIGTDLFELRTGDLQGLNGSTNFAQIAAGWQLSSKFFATLNAGVCINSSDKAFSKNNLGASLEYRMSRDWRLQAAAEPAGTCQSSTALDFVPRRYQLGIDLLWEREY